MGEPENRERTERAREAGAGRDRELAGRGVRCRRAAPNELGTRGPPLLTSSNEGTFMTRLLQLAALSLLLATSTLIPSLSNATIFIYTASLAPEAVGATGSGSV